MTEARVVALDMTRHLSVWTGWNHGRTATPLVAAASFLMALREVNR